MLERDTGPGAPPEINVINVFGANYFRTMGVSVLAGRLFDQRDRAESPRVTVINEAAAREFWPNEAPIGQRIRLGSNAAAAPLEIVGVVSDVRQVGLDSEPFPAAFTLSLQGAWQGFWIVMQTANDATQVAQFVRDQIRVLDRELVVGDLTTMENLIGDSIARPRFATWLAGAFAVLALSIAAVGVYGVMAFAVTQRTQEIGLRMALGAGRRGVLALILSKCLVLASLGTAVGLMAAVAGARLLQNQLFQMSALDPITFAIVPLALLLTALVASWVPALRATRLDPVGALKTD